MADGEKGGASFSGLGEVGEAASGAERGSGCRRGRGHRERKRWARVEFTDASFGGRKGRRSEIVPAEGSPLLVRFSGKKGREKFR